MARYSFLTTWVFESSLEPVWDAIYDTCAWPEWWDELVPRGPDGVGGVTRFTFRSRLPYDLTFDMRSTRVERHVSMEGVASGELAGAGTWRFARADHLTVVTYAWDVSTTARWMNVLAPVARPVFGWNHDHVMRAGAHGLARLLGAPLVTAG